MNSKLELECCYHSTRVQRNVKSKTVLFFRVKAICSIFSSVEALNIPIYDTRNVVVPQIKLQ